MNRAWKTKGTSSASTTRPTDVVALRHGGAGGLNGVCLRLRLISNSWKSAAVFSCNSRRSLRTRSMADSMRDVSSEAASIQPRVTVEEGDCESDFHEWV